MESLEKCKCSSWGLHRKGCCYAAILPHPQGKRPLWLRGLHDYFLENLFLMKSKISAPVFNLYSTIAFCSAWIGEFLLEL